MGDYQVRICERLAGETPACLLGEFLCDLSGRNLSGSVKSSGTHLDPAQSLTNASYIHWRMTSFGSLIVCH